MKIAYDTKLKRPGCAIVQAAFNCDPRVANKFPTEVWLTSPTPEMRVYDANEDQMAYLVKIAEEQCTKK